MSTTKNSPLIIDGREIQLPADRAISITTGNITIRMDAQPGEVEVVGLPAKPKKPRKPHEVRPRHLVQEDRLRLARTIARAGDRGITLIELRDRLGLGAEKSDTAYNDLCALREAGLISTRPGRIPQLLRYYATPRSEQ